ncbi:lipopolysaccharide heptosyltransferase II [Hypnocyclicus thermotrophus]|uniref:Lipopolysaccharide heptosyltransferase II n=2 Tax=Hypnocyclicus thermotrophus TaxID=1627895 RepID=A0AA46I657_9FUSO|nr:lipopolysaccharide heptosyltransferase II [Hypnocyclicus thermotrophus]
MDRKKVLIIRFSSIGDVILTTPILTEIKKKYPNWDIDFIVMDKFKDAITYNSNINKLIIFEKDKYKGKNGIQKFIKEKLKGEYDLIIDLHNKFRSIYISKLLKARDKCEVLTYKKRKWWKSLLVKMRLIKYKVDNTIIKNYFKPLEKYQIYYNGENIEFNFLKEHLEKIKKLKIENFVVFAPGASKETKKWPKENFASLAKLIKKEYNYNIILIGSKAEEKDLSKINKLSGNICINLAGKLNLKESGAIISKAYFVVTNDSGPFHIARGVKTKTFVIFGPTSPGMFEYDKNSILLYENEECSPCSLHGDKKCPKKHFKCMKNLTADKVFKIIKKSS